mmetsp:Transcript_66537/g.164024  ORF Transcript_66537/g.164024 Transcript_66537/m.164024 type:complete len:895 (+) Transcript_66537:211-2895(+)
MSGFEQDQVEGNVQVADVDDLGLKVAETCWIYGPVFIGCFIIFNLIRNRFPRLYNRRENKDETACELSKRTWSPFKWVMDALKTPDEEFVAHSGVDNATMIRINMIGVKLAAFGVLCSIILIPVYRTSPTRPGNETIYDELSRWSLGNCYLNDPRMWVGVVGLYAVSGCLCYLVYKEFDWYYIHRHNFLARFHPSNYTIYVNNLPVHLRSNTALRSFFTGMFGDTVFSTTCSLEIKELEKLYAAREKIIPKLAHAQNVLKVKGERPMHKDAMCGGEKVDSISTYQSQLDEKNGEISARISALEAMHTEHEDRAGKGAPTASAHTRAGGFVTFKSLTAAQLAQQAVHRSIPYEMTAERAPPPKEIVWPHVGLSHLRLEIGGLLALALTALTCLFWTIPVTFMASLSKVDSMKKQLPFLDDAARAAPILDSLLAQLSPLGLIILVALLPPILYQFCKLEGHISEGTLQASLFSKLAYFKLIQVFFVSALGGAIVSKLEELAADPAGGILSALGNQLPGMASYFMTFVLVQCFIGAALELLQLVPAIIAFIRSKIGPNITQKERDTPFLGLAPLIVAPLLSLPGLLSNWVILFMITVVYSVLHPIVCLIMTLVFFLYGLAFRNQIARVYDPSNDTGGLFWPRMAKCLLICLIVAQLTVIAVLGIKEASAPAVLLVPLLVVTVLFFNYMMKQHLRVARQLPSDQAMVTDMKRDANAVAGMLPPGSYVQEALKHKMKQPDGDITDLGGDSPTYVGNSIHHVSAPPPPSPSTQKTPYDSTALNRSSVQNQHQNNVQNGQPYPQMGPAGPQLPQGSPQYVNGYRPVTVPAMPPQAMMMQSPQPMQPPQQQVQYTQVQQQPYAHPKLPPPQPTVIPQQPMMQQQYQQQGPMIGRVESAGTYY